MGQFHSSVKTEPVVDIVTHNHSLCDITDNTHVICSLDVERTLIIGVETEAVLMKALKLPYDKVKASKYGFDSDISRYNFKIQRTSGEIEDNWFILQSIFPYSSAKKTHFVRLINRKHPGQYKTIPIESFCSLNEIDEDELLKVLLCDNP